MSKPKRYIIFGNYDYKGWIWIEDFDSEIEARSYIDTKLKNVTWQWVLTDTLILHGY